MSAAPGRRVVSVRQVAGSWTRVSSDSHAAAPAERKAPAVRKAEGGGQGGLVALAKRRSSSAEWEGELECWEDEEDKDDTTADVPDSTSAWSQWASRADVEDKAMQAKEDAVAAVLKKMKKRKSSNAEGTSVGGDAAAWGAGDDWGAGDAWNGWADAWSTAWYGGDGWGTGDGWWDPLTGLWVDAADDEARRLERKRQKKEAKQEEEVKAAVAAEVEKAFAAGVEVASASKPPAEKKKVKNMTPVKINLSVSRSGVVRRKESSTGDLLVDCEPITQAFGRPARIRAADNNLGARVGSMLCFKVEDCDGMPVVTQFAINGYSGEAAAESESESEEESIAVGRTFDGHVESVKDYGVFVKFGKHQALARWHGNGQWRGTLNASDRVRVKLTTITEEGKLNVSIEEVLERKGKAPVKGKEFGKDLGKSKGLMKGKGKGLGKGKELGKAKQTGKAKLAKGKVDADDW